MDWIGYHCFPCRIQIEKLLKFSVPWENIISISSAQSTEHNLIDISIDYTLSLYRAMRIPCHKIEHYMFLGLRVSETRIWRWGTRLVLVLVSFVSTNYVSGPHREREERRKWCHFKRHRKNTVCSCVIFHLPEWIGSDRLGSIVPIRLWANQPLQ